MNIRKPSSWDMKLLIIIAKQIFTQWLAWQVFIEQCFINEQKIRVNMNIMNKNATLKIYKYANEEKHRNHTTNKRNGAKVAFIWKE